MTGRDRTIYQYLSTQNCYYRLDFWKNQENNPEIVNNPDKFIKAEGKIVTHFPSFSLIFILFCKFELAPKNQTFIFTAKTRIYHIKLFKILRLSDLAVKSSFRSGLDC